MQLTDTQISVLRDMIEDFYDKLNHYPDAEMGWESEHVDAFYDMAINLNEEAKKRKFWWAR